MSNEQVSNDSNNDSIIDMGVVGSNIKTEGESESVENTAQKPKRRYTKRSRGKENEDPESGGERHNIPIQRAGRPGSGSTVQQARSKRKHKSKCDRAIEKGLESGLLGLESDGFTNARTKLRPRKSGKNQLRKICREEEDSIKSESDSDYEDDNDDEMDEYLNAMAQLPPNFVMAAMRPVSLMDKIVTAFAGYPVTTHVSEINPNTTKLVIEVEL